MPELLEHFLIDKMGEREQLMRQLQETQSPQSRTQMMERVASIDEMLGNVKEGLSGDPLADLWEAQMEAGIEPNLDMTMEDLKRG